MSASDESTSGADGRSGTDELPEGWVRIGERHWWSTWSGVGTATFVMIGIYGATQLGRFFDDIAPWPSDLLFGVAAAAGLVGIATLVRNRLYPRPSVNLDTDELRAGRGPVIALSDLERALIPMDPALRSGVLVLRLTAKGSRVEIILRDRRGPALDAVSTRALAEALRRSSVAMPTTPDDPSGRFGRYNFPGHIGREDAVTLVEDPPAPGGALPASW